MLTDIDIEGNELSLNIFLVMSGKLEQVGTDSLLSRLEKFYFHAKMSILC